MVQTVHHPLLYQFEVHHHPVGVELAGLAEDLDIVVVAVEAGAFARIIELKAVARRYLKFL